MWGEGLPQLPRVGKGGTAPQQRGLAALQQSNAEGGFPAEQTGEAGRV